LFTNQFVSLKLLTFNLFFEYVAESICRNECKLNYDKNKKYHWFKPSAIKFKFDISVRIAVVVLLFWYFQSNLKLLCEVTN